MFAGTVVLSADNTLVVHMPAKLTSAAFAMIGQLGSTVPVDLPNYGRVVLMNAAEVKTVGAEKINERGKSLEFTLDGVAEEGMTGSYSKVYCMKIKSQDFDKLRTSYGLTVDYPRQYLVAFAARPTSVFRNDAISKLASECC